MPTLPNSYGARKQASSSRNVRGYSTASTERANNINASILGDVGSDLTEMADDGFERREAEGRRKAQEAKTRHDAQTKGAILNAQERENMAQKRLMDIMYGTDDQPGMYQTKGADALNLESTFEEKWKTINEEMMGGVDNPIAKQALEKSLSSMYMTTLGNVKRHRNAESNTYFQTLTTEKIGIAHDRAGLEWNNEDTFNDQVETVTQSTMQLANAQGVKAKPLVDQQVSQLYENRIIGMLSSDDPSVILDAMDFYNKARSSGKITDFSTAMAIEKALDSVVPQAAAKHVYTTGAFKALKTDKMDIIKFVVGDIEGGDQIVEEPNGGIAKYGINSVAHPEVDVANLDEQGAYDVLAKDHWDAYDIDDVPEDMKLLAFDTATNHRSDFAMFMVERIRAGASPQEVLNLRLQEYQRLVKANPKKYGSSYAGWKNRLEKLSDQMIGVNDFDEKKLEQSAANLDRKYPGAGAELIKLHDAERKRKDAIKKAEKAAVQDRVSEIVSSSNGDYTKVPADLRAQAARMDIDITQYKGVSDSDTLNDLDSMTSEQLFNLDLDDPLYAQNLTYRDLQSYREKQQKLQKPESKMLQGKIDSTVRYYYQAELGKNPDDKNVKANVAAMKRYVEFEAQKLFEKNGSVTDSDLAKMSSDFFKNRKYDPYGMFGFEQSNIYAMPVSDIPKDIRSAIEQSLMNDGSLVTDESVRQRYVMHLRRQGLVEGSQ